jgi:sugar phosphate isomerase/epimerase
MMEHHRRSFLKQLLRASVAPVLSAPLARAVSEGTALGLGGNGLLQGRKKADLGVALGVCSYSLREIPFDAALAALKAMNADAYELWDASAAPKAEGEKLTPAQRADRWRPVVSQDELQRLRVQIADSGLRLIAFTSPMTKDKTDAEIERVFQVAKVLSATHVFSSCNVSMAGRLNTVAGKFSMKIGVHNHSVSHPDQVCSPEDFARAMDGNPHVGVNLDIGHFVAAGFDPVQYISDHHDRVLALHIKDRKKNQGPNTPLGEGDTPIREVLQLLKRNKFPIPALIEYEYKGGDPVTEVRRCLDYCMNALSS